MFLPIGQLFTGNMNFHSCIRHVSLARAGSVIVCTLILFTMLCRAAVGEPTVVAEWAFTEDAGRSAWQPNAHLEDVTAGDDGLRAVGTGHDPFFQNRDIDFEATPGQYLVVRFKADRPGHGQLYWSRELQGQYQGLDPEKHESFRIRGTGEWEEAIIVPFWQGEDRIRQLRLDVFQGIAVTVQSIRVMERSLESITPGDDLTWPIQGDLASRAIHPGSDIHLAPWSHIAPDAHGWAILELQADEAGVAELIWSTSQEPGTQREMFRYQASDEPRVYNIELEGIPSWAGTIEAFGLRVPEAADRVEVKNLTLHNGPGGAADVTVRHFGFEDGVNRAGRSASVLAYLRNGGGEASENVELHLQLPEGLDLTEGQATKSVERLRFDEHTTVTWQVQADEPGTYPIALHADDGQADPLAQAELTFTADPGLSQQEYVPAPDPVESDVDILAYYFPGWDTHAKWDPIRRLAPERKPVLGYYDESDPEVVDWQIKWAVENGIDTFLVDWYWIAGDRILEHWLEAYEQAEYRDELRIALMWANHNPPDTHSHEDWLEVTQHWIDRYFHWDTYYRIDRKPAVFIWDPGAVADDLGGSAAAAEAMAESQQMARDAGYEGIAYVALHDHESEATAQQRHDEGYIAATTYHEWAEAVDRAPTPQQMNFADLVETSRSAWEANRERVTPLDYYPVAATGWDARPWHGSEARVIENRTPQQFRRQLEDLKAYADEHELQRVVLSPLNEWGEGSYIEPNTEFGFAMYEAIRDVFGQEDPAAWPTNIAPGDVGLGPYDLATPPLRTAWDFQDDAHGWRPTMNVADFHVDEGTLRMRASSSDPAIAIDIPRLFAEDYQAFEIEMAIRGDLSSQEQGQLFWSMGGDALREAASVRFPIESGGAFHTYRVDLTEHPRWRGPITSLRLDPCQTQGAEIIIRRVSFE